MSNAQQFTVSTATLTKGSDNVAVARQDLDGSVKNLRSAMSNLLTMWRSAGSVALGSTAVTPALTSSMVAPACTCSIASFFTVSKLPSTISAASFLRPVGLMRSPMTQKGWSKPMTTSRVAEATMVRVMKFSSRT